MLQVFVYACRIMIGTFFQVVAFFACAIILVTTQEVWALLSAGHWWLSLRYLFYIFAERIRPLIPLILLISSYLFLLRWQRSQEWLALQLLGARQSKLFAMMLLFATCLTLGCYTFIELVGPSGYLKAKQLRSKALGHVQLFHAGFSWWSPKHVQSGGLVLNQVGRIISPKRLAKVFILDLNVNTLKAQQVTMAKVAVFANQHWQLRHVAQRQLHTGQVKHMATYDANWAITPALVASMQLKQRAMSLWALFHYWHFVQLSDPVKASNLAFVFYKRLTAPLFAGLLFMCSFVFMSTGLRAKRPAFRLSVGLCLGVALFVMDALGVRLKYLFWQNELFLASLPCLILCVLLLVSAGIFKIRKR